jgi:hypothetical protein
MPYEVAMNTNERTYVIESRYFDGSWQYVRETCFGLYEQAGDLASSKARKLDEKYGNSHFWTVDVKNEKGESYYQLFHGRLS